MLRCGYCGVRTACGLGVAYLALKRPEEAKLYLEKALKLATVDTGRSVIEKLLGELEGEASDSDR